MTKNIDDSFFNKEGKAITRSEWIRFLADENYTKVQTDILPNGKLVSTVYLGLNHNYGRGKPLIFETIVFAKMKNKSREELACERYATVEEAKKGHARMVIKFSKKIA